MIAPRSGSGPPPPGSAGVLMVAAQIFVRCGARPGVVAVRGLAWLRCRPRGGEGSTASLCRLERILQRLSDVDPTVLSRALQHVLANQENLLTGQHRCVDQQEFCHLLAELVSGEHFAHFLVVGSMATARHAFVSCL